MVESASAGDPVADAFLRRFSQASASLDQEAMKDLFAETFLVGDAGGPRVVPREAFLAALPQRAAQAAAAGLSPAELVAATVHHLDDHWYVATATWHAGRVGGDPLEMRSSYLVYGGNGGNGEARIAAYLNHEGLPLRPTS